MRVVGLTGGIGSGKSTVAALLRGLGAPVIDSDELARRVLAPGQPGLREVRAAFGPEAVAADGSLDRAAVGRRVFADPQARRRLEAITHPRIAALRDERIAQLRAAGAPACVLDIPLLFEAGIDAEGLCDEIWVVAASVRTQVDRVMARDGLDEAAVRQRLAAQWPLAEKVERADVVIDNEGDLDRTRGQVETAWRAVLERHGGA